MPKREGEKNKLIILADYLYENTDENHTVSVEPDGKGGMPSMQEYLEKKLGYRPDARSIRRDLALIGKNDDDSPFLGDDLETMGLDLKVKGRGQYYIGERELTLEEVKLLIDVVRSSNFIPVKKTEALVKKLTGFVSRHQRTSLNREVYVRNRVKARNEDVFGNINTISDAINSNHKICFKYFKYTMKNNRLCREYRHDGKIYEVSPFTLIWVDQNYYMLAYSSEDKRITTYRIDRMSKVAVSNGNREGAEEFKKTDMSTFTTKVFHMFRTSEPENVSLEFTESLLDSIVDRFGEDTVIIPDGEGRYSVLVNVCVSPQFYGWLAGFGGQIDVKGPPEARDGYYKYIQEIAEGYEEKNKRKNIIEGSAELLYRGLPREIRWELTEEQFLEEIKDLLREEGENPDSLCWSFSFPTLEVVKECANIPLGGSKYENGTYVCWDCANPIQRRKDLIDEIESLVVNKYPNFNEELYKQWSNIFYIY